MLTEHVQYRRFDTCAHKTVAITETKKHAVMSMVRTDLVPVGFEENVCACADVKVHKLQAFCMKSASLILTSCGHRN